MQGSGSSALGKQPSPHTPLPFPPRGFTLSRLPPLALPQVPVSSVFTQNEMIDAIAITKGHVRGCCSLFGCTRLLAVQPVAGAPGLDSQAAMLLQMLQG